MKCQSCGEPAEKHSLVVRKIVGWGLVTYRGGTSGLPNCCGYVPTVIKIHDKKVCGGNNEVGN